MLIADYIKSLCGQGRLFEMRPFDWRAPKMRLVFVSPQLHQFILQPSTSKRVNEDRIRLHQLFDRFISGRTISVALKRHINGSNIKRLSPNSKEVWEFKITQGPQFRVFGRFAQADTFIALTGPVDRAHCDYTNEIARCQREWSNILPGTRHYMGELQVITSPEMSFLSEILEDTPIPETTLVYFRERLRDRLHSVILEAFMRRSEQKGLKQKALAKRIHRTSAQITRWFSTPSNITLDSISDLMVGLGMDFDAFPFTPIEKTIVTTEPRAEQVALDAVIKGILDKLANQWWMTNPPWAQLLSSTKEQAGLSQAALPSSSPTPKASAASETAEKMQQQTSAGGASIRYSDFQRKAA